MDLVIRSRVTPFSKSCWGVMSLWGPLVSYSHWNEDHRHQSSDWLKWSWLLSEGAPLCWFLLGSSVESPRSRHTPRERAHERERGVVARCVDNEQQTSNWHGQYWVKPHREEGMQCAHTHTHAIANVEGVQWHLTLRSKRLSTPYTRIVLCMTVWSYVFLCLTYMQSCLDTSFCCCCCIGNIVHVMSKVSFFRKLNKTPSPLLSDSSFMLGIVKPGTGQGWATQFTLTHKFEVSPFLFFFPTTLVRISFLSAVLFFLYVLFC